MLGASVIVPARDAARTLPRALDGLARQAVEGGHEVIVVDNGSTDSTAAIAQACVGVTRVLRRARGEGPGRARNAGAEAAGADVLAFLDADCVPAQGWLAAGVAALRDADLVQGRVLPDPGARLGPFDRTLSVGAAHGLFESANLFVRRELFERIGGFGDGLAVRARGAAPFGEDVIFGWRAARVGARTGFCPQAIAYHEVRPRGATEYVAERARLALFPALAARVPELREVFFYRRYFHSRRSASFDLAVGATVLALASTHPAPLLATAPYVRLVGRRARRWGWGRAATVALADLAADGVGAASLLRGSIEARTVLL